MQASRTLWQTTSAQTPNETVYDNIHNSDIDYKNCIDAIQNYITEKSSDLYDNINDSMTHKQRRQILKNYIQEYLTKHKPQIPEFRNPDGTMNYQLLMNRIENDITGYDILEYAMTNDEITEIRINGGTQPGSIWVETHGISKPLIDPTTKADVYFDSTESVTKFITNLLKISRTPFTVTDALAHGVTIEGYRVAATYSTVSARGKTGNFKSPTCVIRKFSQQALTLDDLVRRKTLSRQMASFLRILPKVDLTAVVVGSTGSGKTVTLQSILREAPDYKRILLIQNPAEIDLYDEDQNGRLIRDVVSWEAKDVKSTELAKKPSSPTYSNLMDHSLRFSPQLFVFGELRSDDEFDLSMKAANSGHYFYTTFHADSPYKAINRYTAAVLGAGEGKSENLVKEIVCGSIHFVIVQKRMADGTRKIINISEICGVKKENGCVVPDIRTIFEFRPDPSGKRDENDMIVGKHVQVNTVSEETRSNLLMSGAREEDIKILSVQATPENPVEGDYDF